MNNETPKYTKSIARKLAFGFFMRMLWVFIQINIIIFIALCIFTTVKNETVLKTRYECGVYEAAVADTTGKLVLPGFAQRILPINRKGAVRDFESNENGRLVYRVHFNDENGPVLLAYDISGDIESYTVAAYILFGLEILILIGETVKRKRQIGRELMPIHDIVNAARDATPRVPIVGQLAGQISSIGAKELTKRISVDDKPNELKPLAREINGMLDRIANAYDAQVRFVSDASHELRTPVSVIQGYANLLDRWGKSDEKALQESIDAIKSEAHSMKHLIEQLHFLARGENDSLPLETSAVNLCDLALEAAGDMKIIDADHVYEASLCDAVTVNADRELLKQALRILLENSRKYSPKQTVITTGITQEDGFVNVFVQDNGMGIPAVDLPHVFERFYRSDKSRDRKTGGSGLGLAIAKMIADRHAFRLSVLSREGIGSRFTIRIAHTSPANGAEINITS